jgi:superfamily II DNA or RNA helicase
MKEMELVNISQQNPMLIKINTEDVDYIDDMREHFTEYVEGFQYMPQYRSGGWNGKTCMMHKFNTLPYGLLFELMKAHKKYFPRHELTVDPEVKAIFRGPTFIPRYNLSLYPRNYQKESIRACLNYTKGIIRSATASGKSLVISYIVKTLLERKKSGVENAIIIVPTISLVEQFYGDMIEYGIPEDFIGRVHGKSKQWDYPITISTWQTLRNNHDKLMNYNCVIVDEVHQSKAFELKKILVKSIRARYRLGFTGTLHSGVLDNWNTKSYLGPVLKEYPSGLLADKGFISKCNVNVLNLEYKGERHEGTYDEVKDEVFTNEFRLSIINKLVDSLDHNTLLLVGKVEKEGDYLKDNLNTNKEVVFLSGRDSVELREEWRGKMADRKDVALIATYGIFQQGINIPNLKYIILASPFKSKIRVLQSIGRALRSHADKENGAYIFDLHDHTTFFEKHGDIRYRYYDSEKFHISEYLFEEGDTIDIDKIEVT